MSAATPRLLDVIAAIGLALGGVLGLAGTVVGRAELRQALWALDGVGLVVATALLTVKFLRQGNDCLAAGFLVFVVGESLLLSGHASSFQELVIGSRIFRKRIDPADPG